MKQIKKDSPEFIIINKAKTLNLQSEDKVAIFSKIKDVQKSLTESELSHNKQPTKHCKCCAQ